MGLAEDWGGYASPSTLLAPGASVTDFVYLVSLDQMPASWWSAVRSDGGDIRASKADNTELPCDLIEWNYAGQSGLLAVRYTGTQATSPGNIRIWCGNADATAPAVAATYGRYNTYSSAIKAFYPSGGGNDRTGNLQHLTMTDATAGDTTGPINGSKATTYNGTSSKGVSATGSSNGNSMFLASSYDTKGAGTSIIFCRSTSTGSITDGIFNISSSSEFYGVYRDGAGSPLSTNTGVSVPLNVWGASSAGFDNDTGQIFVYDYTGGSSQVSSTDGSGNGILIGSAGTTHYWGGRVSLALYTTDVSARAAFSAYWFAMVDAADPDQSDFYGTWSWTANDPTFPTDWAGYDSPSTLLAPTASVTNFTYFISLSSLSATWWSNVKSDGGDIRVSKADGVTRLPCDLIYWNYAGNDGLLAVQYPGVQGTTPDVPKVWCGNASATAPDNYDTYGRYAAYDANFRSLYHKAYTGDRTINNHTLGVNGLPTTDVAGPINGSLGTTLNGSTQAIVAGNSSIHAITGPITLTASLKSSSTADFGRGIVSKYSYSTNQRSYILQMGSTANGYGLSWTVAESLGSAGSNTVLGSTALNSNTWKRVAGKYTPSTDSNAFVDGVGIGADLTVPASIPDGTAKFMIGNADAFANGFAATLSMVGVHDTARSDAWLSYDAACLKGTDPDQSDFFGTWSWTTNSGSSHSLTADTIATGAPSVGSPTLGQVHALTATGVATGSPTVGSPSLSGEVSLTATGINTGAPTVGSPALGQVHALAATGVATGAPTVSTPTLGQSHDLTATGIDTGSPTTGTPTLGIDGELTAVGIATGAPTVGSPTLGQEHALTATGIATGAPTVGTPSMSGSVELTATGLTTGAPTVGVPALGQLHALATAGIASGVPSVGSPLLSQLHVLTATAISLGAPTVGSPGLDAVLVYPKPIRITGDARSSVIIGDYRSSRVIGDNR